MATTTTTMMMIPRHRATAFSFTEKVGTLPRGGVRLTVMLSHRRCSIGVSRFGSPTTTTTIARGSRTVLHPVWFAWLVERVEQTHSLVLLLVWSRSACLTSGRNAGTMQSRSTARLLLLLTVFQVRESFLFRNFLIDIRILTISCPFHVIRNRLQACITSSSVCSRNVESTRQHCGPCR